MFNFLSNIGPTELILIGVILVVVFGATAATRLGRTGGETLKELKNIKKNIGEVIPKEDK